MQDQVSASPIAITPGVPPIVQHAAVNATKPMHWAVRLQAILIGSIGNLIEWYDFYAYAAFSLYFAKAFFPSGNQTTELLSSAGVFALGFFMRPVGSLVIGRLADRGGRRRALTFSVLLMCFGSLLVAVTPTYDSIGVAAPMILITARLIQGFSLGAEYGTSATYLSEMADPAHRGFWSSFQAVTLAGGQLCALLVLIVLQKLLLTPEQLDAWGWRIPFVIGAALSVFAYVMRRHMHETPAFEAGRKDAGRGSLRVLLQHPRQIGFVVGLTVGGAVAFYTYTTYMQKFLVNSAGLTRDQGTLVSGIALLLFVCLAPPIGALSDRIGRKATLLIFAVLGTLCTVPLLTALGGTRDPWTAFVLLMAALVILSFHTSINAVVKAELFPSGVRVLGVGLPYAITTSLFGGTAEYIALWFKDSGHESRFYWYVTGCIAVSLVTFLFMPDTRSSPAMAAGATANSAT